MTNYQSNSNDDRGTSSSTQDVLTLDDMLEAVRSLKRPVLSRIEIAEDMFGFISDLVHRAAPKLLMPETPFGGVLIVDSEWLPVGWARGVDQDGNTLFLLSREHFYDFSKVSMTNYFDKPLLPAIKPPTERLVFWNHWWVNFP
jgi:hypothetical protein